jgi:glycosyltransferase involved in cell wall biosynthesis
VLDNQRLLRFVGRYAISTDASKLGAMTVSVLAGRDGLQRKEVGRLMDYLRGQPAPEAIVITNALLLGLAPELRRVFTAPLLCELQGEDAFLESIPEPHRTQAWELMRRGAESVDLLIATSDDCAARMGQHLALRPERIRTVRTGLDAADYRALAAERAQAAPRSDVFTVGYLSAITRSKGLDLLVEACRSLAAEGRQVRLIVAGLALEAPYWREVKLAVERAGLEGRFEYRGEVDREGKLDLLRACDAFSVPSRFPEARGVAMMEAIAAGVPVAAPNAGIYPELMLAIGGDFLFASGDASGLASCLTQIMDHPAEAAQAAQSAAQAIAERYGVAQATTEMEAALEAAASIRRGAT